MKKSILVLLVIAVVGTLAGVYYFRQSDLRLQMQLENAYLHLLDASEKGDEEALREALAGVIYARLRNDEVARFGVFREWMIRRVTANTPDMTQYDFFGVLKDGDRALLAYRPLSDEVHPVGALLLRSFIYERGAWRVERQDFLNAGKWLPDQPFRFTVRTPNYPPHLKVDRPLEAAPPLIPVPDIPSELYVRSNGYETRVEINGKEVLLVKDGEDRIFIPGGLHAPNNPIRIDVRAVESKTVMPEVNVIVSTFDDAGRALTVFQYAPLEDAPPPYDAVIQMGL